MSPLNFAVKVADIVGLYLNPPEGAVVLSMDEKTQVQALDRTQPLLPMNFCKTEKRTHDYVRHGTTNLFAALNTKTGEVIGRCFQRRRAVEFLKFMDDVVVRYPDKEIHVIVDNLSTFHAIHPYLPTHGWLAYTDLFRMPVAWDAIVHGLLVDVVYTAVFLAAALFAFGRRDVHS